MGLIKSELIDEQQVFKQVGNCLLEKMDDDILLYNPANTLTLHMNESSAVVWHLLDGKTSVLELIKLLQEQFPEARQQIEADVFEVLEKMLVNKVIQALQHTASVSPTTAAFDDHGVG